MNISMANNCKAKVPSACRVHGKGGEIDRLQKIADKASRSGNMSLYLSTRAEMKALTDDKKTEFSNSLRNNNAMEPWKDHSGNLLADTPNDVLVTHLYNSASHEVSDTDQVTELLRIRGYGDQDLLLAKHFKFEKDGNQSTNSVTARKITRLTDEIEKKNNVRYPPAKKEAFINKYFDLRASTAAADRSQCKQFVEDYEKYVTA